MIHGVEVDLEDIWPCTVYIAMRKVMVKCAFLLFCAYNIGVLVHCIIMVGYVTEKIASSGTPLTVFYYYFMLIPVLCYLWNGPLTHSVAQ